MTKAQLQEQIAQQEELVRTSGNLYDQGAYKARLEQLKAELGAATPKKTPKDE